MDLSLVLLARSFGRARLTKTKHWIIDRAVADVSGCMIIVFAVMSTL
jgi:hypothetical protein